MYRKLRYSLIFLTLAGGLLQLPVAQAVPSFARQTGLACEACHQAGNFPELNSFGRQFKMSGYTMAFIKEIEPRNKEKGDQNPALSLINIPLLSAMVQVSGTHTAKAQPDQQNNSTQFPQQLSVFLAGRITPHVGTFIQTTMSDTEGFSLDLADIRYANQTAVGGKSLLYGLTLNNAPTVEDPWNSTPVWGFPWSGSDQAPSPAASTMIEGGPDLNVTGLGAYGMLADTVYGDLSFYRSSGTNDSSSTDVIKNVAPYWRLAYDHTFGNTYVMVGTYGMYAEQYDNGISGPTHKTTDLALDTQIEQPLWGNMLTVHGAFIHENRDPSSGSNVTYKHYKLDGSYHFTRKLRATLGYSAFDTGSDNINTDSWVAQMAYYPWENLNLTLQYTAYTKFDGSTSNASDNNTTYVLAWLVF